MSIGFPKDFDHDQVRNLLTVSGVLHLNSHFVYKEGTHGRQYIDKDDLLSNPKTLNGITALIAGAIMQSRIPFDVICGIATGANGLSACVASELNHAYGRSDFRSIFVIDDPEDPKHKKLIKGSLQKHVKGARIMLIEDIVNNGNSLRGAIEILERNGGDVSGVICVANRSKDKIKPEHFGLNDELFLALAEFQMDNYPEAECPLCKEQGIESVRTDLGKGKQFLAEMKEQGRIK